MNRRIMSVLAVLAAALLVMANCKKGDRIAPEDAIIDVAANPSTILVSEQVKSGGMTLNCTDILNVSKCGTSEIVATVSSAVGVPLPDQDVRFTNTAGLLFAGTLDNPEPIANLPVRTDSYGNAHVNLVTGSTTTVNARSGKATGSLSLQTTSAYISSISVEQDTASTDCSSTSGEITDCGDKFCLTATVQDSAGKGIPGLQIQFRLQGATGDNSFTGTFTPQQDTTDATGVAATKLQAISSDCSSNCAGGKCVSVDVVAYITGGIESPAFTILINIP
jgi:hypothetical protein